MLARLQRRPGPGHRGRGSQRRVRRERARVRRRAARPHRARRASSTSTARRCSSTCGRARSATCSRTTLRADHGVTCGHWPQSMALSTVGGWLACRGAGQLSTRYGKIEDIVDGLDVVLADGTARHDRRRAACRGRARSHAALRRLGRNARRHRRRPAARSIPLPPAHARAAFGFTSFTDGLDACGASSSAARRPRCCGSTTRSKPTAATRPATPPCCSRSTKATRTSSTRRCRIVDEECAGADRARRRARRAVDRAPQRRVRARGADRRAASSSTRWRSPVVARPPGDLRAAATEAMLAVERTVVASAHQWHSYTDGGVPLLHVRRQPPRRTPGPTTTAPRGTPAPAPCSRPAARSATTTASGSTGPASSRDALGPGFGVLAVGEGGARPERDPQPRQARARQPVRPAPAWP